MTPRLETSGWKNLAVLAPNWLGDAVMCEPAIRALAATFPTLRITLHGRPIAGAALADHPAIAEFRPVEDRGVLGPVRAARRIAETRPDAILLLRGSFRSALVARLCRCPIRIGVARDGRSGLLSHPLPGPSKNDPRPTVDLYASLVEALGVPVEDRLPRLQVSESERLAAAPLLDGLPRPILGLVPGGSKMPKRWPAGNFVETARRLRGIAGSIVLIGGPDERELLASIAEDLENCSNPVVRDLGALGLGLHTLRAVVGGCDALVTNDTGPRHLAVGLGVPTVALFGPTDHRWTLLPGARERILLAEPFLDQAHVADRHPEACRIDRIAVGDVVHAVSGFLDPASVSSTT
ncbi:MAG: hypothetical protein CMJ51_03965 [Planctomycetaceae bacterium]|nr:hypothetical protein [Planctomycetaceae bacterium]